MFVFGKMPRHPHSIHVYLICPHALTQLGFSPFVRFFSLLALRKSHLLYKLYMKHQKSTADRCEIQSQLSRLFMHLV